MSKILELIGFACVGGTIYAFLGLTPGDPIRWPLFWTFAAGALVVILYRKWKKKDHNSK